MYQIFKYSVQTAIGLRHTSTEIIVETIRYFLHITTKYYIMYYIYHIEGIKIGCTKNYPSRCIEQGYTTYELLETHNNINTANSREQILQEEYGYGSDNRTYIQAVSSYEKSKDVWHSAGGSAGKCNEWRIQHNTIISKKGVESNNKKVICPYCSKEGQSRAMKRWHGDNCKQKKEG